MLPEDQQEKRELIRHFSNRSRKAIRIGNRILVPRVLDDQGQPIDFTVEKPRHVWDFNLKEARFLKALQDASGDLSKACREARVEPAWARRFLRSQKSVQFLAEETQKQKLAAVATPTFIKAELVRAAIGESNPSDNQKWGLEKLKDIVIPRQGTNVQINNNIYNTPQLSAAEEAKLKAMGDALADVVDVEAKVA
jgi:hypothetical protein